MGLFSSFFGSERVGVPPPGSIRVKFSMHERLESVEAQVKPKKNELGSAIRINSSSLNYRLKSFRPRLQCSSWPMVHSAPCNLIVLICEVY